MNMREFVIDTEQGDRLLDDLFDTTSYVEEDEWGDEDLPDDEDEDGEKGVRHVRTPAGVEKYGQPIGSVIKPDVAPNTPETHLGIMDGRTMLDVIHPAYAAPNKRPKWTDREYHGEQRSFANVGNYTIMVEPNWNRQGYRWSLVSNLGGGNRSDDHVSGVTTDVAKGKQAATRALRKREQEKQPRMKADYSGLLSGLNGVYGYDYWSDGSVPTEEEQERFLGDTDYRYDLAKRHSREMGMGYTSDTGNTLDINVHEVINDNFESINYLFPGFTQELMINIGVGEYMGALAWNAPEFRTGGGEPRLRQGTSIMFSDRYFGSRDDSDFIDRKNGEEQVDPMGWTSVDPDQVLESDEQLERWQVHAMNITTHEIGHTFGRVAMGQLMDREHAEGDQAIAKEFYEGLFNAFYNHGLLKESDRETMDQGNFNSRAAIAMSNAKDAMAQFFDTKEIREMMSTYGAHSVHEFVAEAFAEYMMSPEPRLLSVDVGTLLSNAMYDYLSNRGHSQE